MLNQIFEPLIIVFRSLRLSDFHLFEMLLIFEAVRALKFVAIIKAVSRNDLNIFDLIGILKPIFAMPLGNLLNLIQILGGLFAHADRLFSICDGVAGLSRELILICRVFLRRASLLPLWEIDLEIIDDLQVPKIVQTLLMLIQ